MKKKYLLLVASLFCLGDAAHAQLFDEWEDAVDDLNRSLNQMPDITIGVERKAEQTGNEKAPEITEYGDNPGVEFRFLTCFRQGTEVRFCFQLTNRTSEYLTDVCLRCRGENAVMVENHQGKAYTEPAVEVGGKSSRQGLRFELPATTTANCCVVLSNVPMSVSHLASVQIGSSVQSDADSPASDFGFQLKAVPILTVIEGATVLEEEAGEEPAGT